MSDALHLVCPGCSAVNRIPSDRLAQKPKCGKCHNAIFDNHPTELTSATFAKHIERNDIPVLVDFWAPWCGPCRQMAPHFEQAVRVLEPNVRLAKVNTEAEQSLAVQYGIASIPTLALFKGGREIARKAGAMGTQDIARWVSSHSRG